MSSATSRPASRSARAADPLAALLRASALVAEGLAEDQLSAQLARAVCDLSGADACAVYIAANSGKAAGKPLWRLAGSCGADPEVLQLLPATYGEGAGILAPLFQMRREVREDDLLGGAPAETRVPAHFPARSLVGLPLRRRDGRAVGVLLVLAREANAFEATTASMRALAQLLAVGLDNARLAAAQQRERRMAAESAVTLGNVLESVGSGVCVVDLDGTVRLANKALQDLFGFGGRTLGLPQPELFSKALVRPRDFPLFLTRLRELVADPAQIDESEWDLEATHAPEAGPPQPPRVVHRHSAPMRNLVGEVVGRVEVYTDVTEGRRLYAQLLNSEKLRAIGEMASGVAHDFNNLLASIVGQTELLHPDELPPPAQQAIATIRQAALDGARMIRRLQSYSRPAAETASTAADLNETVQVAIEMARPRWAGAALHGRAFEIGLQLAETPGLPRVAIDPAELREVLLNMLFNATEAMPDGGRIDVTTRPSRTPGFAELEVRDTGHGMPESVRARIFQPFFSTKGPKGSGLGLAVAYSIISRHSGEISVESKVGQGTTFVIRLPYAPTAPAATQAADEPAPAAARPRPATTPNPSARLTGARILVVDDEPGLVAVVRQLMERSGALVRTANGGPAALEALHEPDASYDVVITDLDMPSVDGWAVAAEAKARFPGTPVVMLTGWAGEIAPEDFRERGVDVALAKPCSRAELEGAIAHLLAPRPAAGLAILIVDDEAVFANSIRDLLGLDGHQVTVVDSAETALAITERQRFDVVLTDYSLGSSTGSELAERLADRPHPPALVLITGYATEIDDPTLLGRGISAVLPKPCRGDDLRAVLARFAGQGGGH